MSEPVELEQLTDAGASADPPGMADLRRLSDVPIDLTVEIGRTRLTVGETLELRQGSILTLNRMAGEPVDLLVNGTPIARLYSAGELGSIYSYLYQGTGNIGECLAFGRIAGRNAVAEVGWG